MRLTRSLPRSWVLAVAVGLIVAAFQLWLVGIAGNDTPLDDEWDREGSWLYPRWVSGDLHVSNLLAPHNEHRILWTYLLDLGIFSVNGQWDPRVQLAVLVLLRAALAAGLARWLTSEPGGNARWPAAVFVGWMFLPHLARHNVLWGFQTQVYFSLGFSLLALRCFTREPLTGRRWLAGVLLGIAAQWGMSAGCFVPVALSGLLLLQVVRERRFTSRIKSLLAAVALLAALGVALRTTVPELASQRAASPAAYFHALGLGLSWPYPANPWIALAACLPLALATSRRLAGRPALRPGEDFVLGLGCFGLAAALAQAFFRGGADEFSERVPSRYTEFMVLLVLANAWCTAALVSLAPIRWRLVARTAGAAWLVLLAAGWLATSSEVWRKALRPRIEYREVPGQLVRLYQVSGDPEVFATAGRFFQPHPQVAEIGRALREPRMRGRLPPSLQPERPVGLLSALMNVLFRHWLALVLTLFGAATLLLWNETRRSVVPESKGSARAGLDS